jgi:hypothetical protein
MEPKRYKSKPSTNWQQALQDTASDPTNPDPGTIRFEELIHGPRWRNTLGLRTGSIRGIGQQTVHPNQNQGWANSHTKKTKDEHRCDRGPDGWTRRAPATDLVEVPLVGVEVVDVHVLLRVPLALAPAGRWGWGHRASTPQGTPPDLSTAVGLEAGRWTGPAAAPSSTPPRCPALLEEADAVARRGMGGG